MNPDSPIDRLRGLIGQRFDYLGEPWRLLEVLAAEDALVLVADGGDAVQSTQYGQPQRRVPRTLTLPLSDSAGSYSDEVIALLAGRRR